MEKLPENDLEQIEATTVLKKPSTGYLLRSARESLGLSVEDVVVRIKLAPRQIIALEADDFKALPELAFIRGFVRSYAKLLQLEVQPLLDGLPGAVKERVVPAPVEVSFSAEKELHQKNVNWLAAALIVVLLIGVFVIWQARTERPTVEVVVAASSAVPEIMDTVSSEVAAVSSVEVPAPTEIISAPVAVLPVTQPVAIEAAVVSAVPPVQVSTENAAVRLAFDKESWAEIKDASGKTLVRQVNQPGSELRVNGVPPLTLIIGHATAAHLFFREKPVDLGSYINAGSDVARMTLK